MKCTYIKISLFSSKIINYEPSWILLPPIVVNHAICHFILFMKSSQKNCIQLILDAFSYPLRILVCEKSFKNISITIKYFIKPKWRILFCILNIFNFNIQINFFSFLLKLSQSHSLFLNLSSLFLFSSLLHNLIKFSSLLIFYHII